MLSRDQDWNGAGLWIWHRENLAMSSCVDVIKVRSLDGQS